MDTAMLSCFGGFHLRGSFSPRWLRVSRYRDISGDPLCADRPLEPFGPFVVTRPLLNKLVLC